MAKKAVVVDNNKFILELVRIILEAHGYEVRLAENGLSALELLSDYRPAVIFIDMVMPKINGEQLCRIIRSNPEFKTTYLVILSAVAAEQLGDFSQCGADACIAKGPYKKMEKHISSVLGYIEKNDTIALGKQIFGYDTVKEREITNELIAIKRHYEIALNNISDGFLELAANNKIVFTNYSAARMLGVPEEKLLSTDFCQLFPPTERQQIETILDRLETPLQIGEAADFRLNGKNVLFNFEPIIDRGQKTVIVIVHDITERKAAEKKLQEYYAQLESTVASRTTELSVVNEELRNEVGQRRKTEKLLRLEKEKIEKITGNIGAGIAEISKDYRVLWVNTILKDIFGDVEGKLCHEVFYQRHEICPDCGVEKILAGAADLAVHEQQGQDKNGNILWSQIIATPLHDLDGNIISVLEVVFPITDRKLQEQEREKLIDELKEALTRVKVLSGLLPICASCKRIRDDQGYWNQIESYIRNHSDADFSHGICPDCAKKLYPQFYDT